VEIQSASFHENISSGINRKKILLTVRSPVDRIESGMSTETRIAPESGEIAPTPQDCRELLARLVASKHFRRSERHCAFLSYVSNVALTEPAREIKETELGCKVFGRPEGYDTAQDNIVRVNASEVRRRLEQYFLAEGAVETFGMEIPRGSYRPLFKRRVRALEVQQPPLPAPPEPKTSPARMRWILPLLCFALGVASTWLVRRTAPIAPLEKDPVVRQLWSRFFSMDTPTDVLLADSCLSLFEDLTKQTVSLHQYVNREYLSSVPPNSTINQEQMQTLMDRHYTSMADVQLMRRLTLLAPPADQQKLTVYFARDYSADSLLKSNAIIIGSKRANPWAEPFERSMNFRFEFFEDTNITSIHNEHPLPGERSSYDQVRIRPNLTESYSVVALLPNPKGTGSVLLLEGSNMDATQAAGEFVGDGRLLMDLKKRLGASANANFPYFEVLLQSRRLGGGAVEDIAIKAVRKH
jgi:hypothetical protein